MIANGKALLVKEGWTQDEKGIFTKKSGKNELRLSFTITTTKDAPELLATADILKRRWGKMGADVSVKVFDTKTNLENNAIRPREYDVLLFGEIIGRDSDPYAFWHSSQRMDPGLNIALYTNRAVDTALQKARAATDKTTRVEQYKVFQEAVRDDVPAVFLYSPQLIYLTRDTVRGMNLRNVNTPSERFLDIYSWFVKTEHVWKIFQ
jgi:peptide/nickel transport system substrate-binding protein